VFIIVGAKIEKKNKMEGYKLLKYGTQKAKNEVLDRFRTIFFGFGEKAEALLIAIKTMFW
jgi:hypothetical protein